MSKRDFLSIDDVDEGELVALLDGADRHKADRRTRDTLDLVLPELRVEPKIVYEDALYHASAEEMLDMLHGIQPGANRVMLVGHNPEIQSFALDLVGSGPKHLRDRLRTKYPTAGLAVINFSSGLWPKVAINSGTLNLFLAPKDLRA